MTRKKAGRKRNVKFFYDFRNITEIGRAHVLGALRTPGPPEAVPAANGLKTSQLYLAEQLRSARRQLGEIMSQFAKIRFPTTVGNFWEGWVKSFVDYANWPKGTSSRP